MAEQRAAPGLTIGKLEHVPSTSPDDHAESAHLATVGVGGQVSA